MKELFKNKTILITGGGTIGSELLNQLLIYDIEQVRIIDNNELILHNLKQKYKNNNKIRYLFGDIRDIDRLNIAMRGVDFVFHTAAMKHVSFCEENPIDAIYTNVLGTENVINAAIREECSKFINISTDKAINPVNVMGATKLLTERLVAVANNLKGRTNTIFTSVRFGNVLASSGSVIPIFENQIKNNLPLTVTDKDATRFMMRIEDAVNLILNTISISKGNEIFILKMPTIKIIDIAKQMNKQYGRDENNIVFTGLIKGEKLHEELITKEESQLAMQNDKMLVIPPEVLISYYESIGFRRLI